MSPASNSQAAQVSAAGTIAAAARARSEVVEDASLVRREALVARRAKPNEEGSGPALLDVDDVPRGEVDQGRGNRVVGHPEAVREEVDDRRRLAAELERPGTDRRLRRRARDEDGRRGREPGRGRGSGDEREEEFPIRRAGPNRVRRSGRACGPCVRRP
jgi:hypothetical protein